VKIFIFSQHSGEVPFVCYRKLGHRITVYGRFMTMRWFAIVTAGL
jgi:hypothetical protein